MHINCSPLYFHSQNCQEVFRPRLKFPACPPWFFPGWALAHPAPPVPAPMRAGCSKAEPKNFAPPQTPFPWTRDGQNLISWRWSLPLPTNPVWWRPMPAISRYRGNRPTHQQTHTHPQTGPITIHCDCAAASAQCSINAISIFVPCAAKTGTDDQGC